MEFLFTLTLLISICIGHHVISVISADADVDKCNGVDMKMTEETAMNIMDCLKEAGDVKSWMEVPEDKKACFGKCVLNQKGLVDEMGMPHKENIAQLVNTTMPEEVTMELNMKVEKCIDENASKIQPDSKYCDTYWPMVECFHMVFTEVCKQDDKMKM